MLEVAAQGGFARAWRSVDDVHGALHGAGRHDVHNTPQVPQLVLSPNKGHGLVAVPGFHQPAQSSRDFSGHHALQPPYLVCLVGPVGASGGALWRGW